MPDHQTCKHYARCNHEPGDDCYECSRPTEPCPPPEHIAHDDALYQLEAHHSMRRHRVLPRRYTRTLDRVACMRANLERHS